MENVSTFEQLMEYIFKLRQEYEAQKSVADMFMRENDDLRKRLDRYEEVH